MEKDGNSFDKIDKRSPVTSQQVKMLDFGKSQESLLHFLLFLTNFQKQKIRYFLQRFKDEYS